MPKAKFTTEQSAPSFAKPASATPDVKADRSIRLDRPDAERLDGTMRKRGRPAKMEGKTLRLSSLLDRRIKTRRASGAGAGGGFAGDLRHQAVVKIHYFSHAGGGGGGSPGTLPMSAGTAPHGLMTWHRGRLKNARKNAGQRATQTTSRVTAPPAATSSTPPPKTGSTAAPSPPIGPTATSAISALSLPPRRAAR